MKCFECGKLKLRTIYPVFGGRTHVRKVCDTCGWKSYPTKVPDPIKRCQE